MPKLLIVVLLLLSSVLQAQFKVTLRIKNLPSYHISAESVFIAGSFNNWNPGHAGSQFQKVNGIYTLSLAAPAGKHEYKLTRGTWEKVESDGNGSPVPNRIIEVRTDTTVEISISHWADHFPKSPKKSTAGKNVKIISTNFFIPQLNRYRRVWIYLPENYSSSGKNILCFICTTGKMFLKILLLIPVSGEWMKRWIL